MNQGLTDAQIAKRLNLTRGSAAASVGRIRLKFGGGARHDVVTRARTLGIIRAPKGSAAKPPARAQTRSARRSAAQRAMPSTPCLTACELQVLDLMNRGLSNGEIAVKLGVTLPSVNSYVTNVRTRIGGATRFEVVRRAREMKLVKTPKSGSLQ